MIARGILSRRKSFRTQGKGVRTRGGGGCMAYADAGGRGEGGLCRCGRPISNHLSSLKSFS